MCAFVVLGLVFPYQVKRLACGTSPKWPVLCQSINHTPTDLLFVVARWRMFVKCCLVRGPGWVK